MRIRRRSAASKEPFALRHSALIIFAGIVITTAVAVFGVLEAPHVLGRPHLTGQALQTQDSNLRDTWLKLSAGVAAAFAAIVAGGRLELSKRQYSTDLFSRAVEQLGNEATDIRLGGIYALERTYRSSPGDRGPIVEVLAAYVRGHLPPSGSLPEIPEAQRPAPLPTDVQAALTVLGRLATSSGAPPVRVDLSGIDTSVHQRYRANLTGANLTGANLARANLARANLTRANLTRANLTGANLTGANLTDVNLFRANLIHANLTGADLTDANLFRANLTDANLTHANLTRADLTGANLTGVNLFRVNLFRANLTGADLFHANLTDANLTDAALFHANLTGANLTRAKITTDQLRAARSLADVTRAEGDLL